MGAQLESQRVLVAATEPQRVQLRSLLAGHLPGWEINEAESAERVRFVQQLDPCDVLLLDSSLTPEGDSADLRWLMAETTPVLYLSDAPPEVIQASFQQGVTHYLPRQLAVANPGLLAAVLQQAAQVSDMRRMLQKRESLLVQCRRQVSRLVEMLWQAVPSDAQVPWLTQRHMMERLHEEVGRSQRHGDPLAVVLGEINDEEFRPLLTPEDTELVGWTARQVTLNKRRHDVAGQYGPSGFILLLPHTTDRGAIDCCRRLRPLLEDPRSLPEGVPPFRVSFGIASFSVDTASVKSLLGRAEERLQQARTNPLERLAF